MNTSQISNQQTCKYHPRDSAAWFCRHCKINFCANCTPQQVNDPYPNCTLCRRSLTRLSIAQDIPPFWTRLSLFFLAPFNKNILIMILVYSFLGSMLPTGMIGKIAFILFLVPFVSAEFDLLEKISTGNKLNFTPNQLINSKQSALAIKAFVVAAFAALLVNKLSLVLGDVTGYAFMIMLLLGFPASIAIFVMEKNILSPINPLKIVMLIKLFTKAYVFLFLLTLICGYFVSKAYSIVIEASSPFFVSMLLFAVSFYLITVIFLMVGYLLYQYHVELNYTINAFDPNATSYRKADRKSVV